MKKLAGSLFVILVLLVAVLAANTLRFGSRQIAMPADVERMPDVGAAVQRLAQAVRFRTVSSQDPASFPGGEFGALHAFLAGSFPRMHSALAREKINGHSLLYEWRGSDASLAPILLLAHQDVVPADPASLDQWTHPPFSGKVAEGFIWGRGTLDDKGSLMALHEAVEALLTEGFRPARTVYFGFGHDEEVGGRQGAAKISARLAERGIRLESVLDEGQVVTSGIVPGFNRPVALIGIAEKGYLSLELLVEAEGGHSSMPPRQTAIGTLAAAIARLENAPFPAALPEPVRRQFEYLGPEQGWVRRVLFSNLWLFSPLVRRQMEKTPATAAMLRTTTAPIMLEGSIKENVLPMRAQAVVNFRILPGSSTEEVVARVRAVVDDPRVRIAAIGTSSSEPSPVADPGGEAFTRLHRAVSATFPDAIIAPSLVLGATDTRHFIGIAANLFRFLPARLGPDDLKRYHGINERLPVDDYGKFIRFYMRYLREAAG
ncbi:MAG TPA: M20 family peptidase [Burkholderiales bacterium]